MNEEALADNEIAETAEIKLAMKEEAMEKLAMKEEANLAKKNRNKEKDEVEVKFPPFITDEIKKKSPPGFWENWFKEEAKLAKKKLNRAKSHPDYPADINVLTPEQEEKDSVLTPEQEKQSETVTFRNKDPGFESDMERYNYDMNRSDGFDVGKYPHMFGSVNYSANWVSCYYNPQINQTLPRSRLDTLLCLSNLAISLYNMHQCPPTYYDSVKVLKAMRFGVSSYNNYNLTFQASLPAQLPVTFQTKVKTQKMSKFFEIVFVRKVKGGDDDDQEIDFMLGEKNVSQEIDDDDDDDEDTHIYSPYTDSGFKLALPLSQLALHMFHENTNSSYDLRYELQTVNVLETKKSVMSAQEGATYLITFEAFWPRMGFEIFQTKIHLSPLVPPVSIRIKSVKILPPCDHRYKELFGRKRSAG